MDDIGTNFAGVPICVKKMYQYIYITFILQIYYIYHAQIGTSLLHN